VVASIQEHDKVHLDLDGTVVLFKELLDLLNKYSKVMDLPVCSRIGVNAFHIVTIDQSVCIVDSVLLNVECLGSYLNAIICQPGSVDVVDQTITKDTEVLVQPQSDDVNDLHDCAAISQAKTL